MWMFADIERNLAARVHADLDVAGVVDFLKLTQEEVEGYIRKILLELSSKSETAQTAPFLVLHASVAFGQVCDQLQPAATCV
jgi:hypothetical protein